ncbi:hypothetical protein C6502_14875 [Candidatus Poribacteria bacterium]|nr:MAG: hypothetical protein C6502_14875 [Candidatus Poribacteria bacterium]
MARKGAPPPKRRRKSIENFRTPDFSNQYWSEVADSLLWLFDLTRVNQNFIEECTDPILMQIADFLNATLDPLSDTGEWFANLHESVIDRRPELEHEAGQEISRLLGPNNQVSEKTQQEIFFFLAEHLYKHFLNGLIEGLNDSSLKEKLATQEIESV